MAPGQDVEIVGITAADHAGQRHAALEAAFYDGIVARTKPPVAERKLAQLVVAVGIDTPSIDHGQSADFRTHVILYAENISGLENVANLDLLPASGSYAVALPMKIEGGSGGPLRIVAFVPRDGS